MANGTASVKGEICVSKLVELLAKFRYNRFC